MDRLPEPNLRRSSSSRITAFGPFDAARYRVAGTEQGMSPRWHFFMRQRIDYAGIFDESTRTLAPWKDRGLRFLSRQRGSRYEEPSRCRSRQLLVRPLRQGRRPDR